MSADGLDVNLGDDELCGLCDGTLAHRRERGLQSFGDDEPHSADLNVNAIDPRGIVRHNRFEGLFKNRSSNRQLVHRAKYITLSAAAPASVGAFAPLARQ